MQTTIHPSMAPAQAPAQPIDPVTVWNSGDAPVVARPHRFSADAYEQMIAIGVLAEDDRCELIEGSILEMSPIGSRHASVVAKLCELLMLSFGRTALIWAQNPIRLGDASEPQPDVAVLRRADDDYAEALPLPSDIRLVVEISDTTLDFDLNVKLPLYARHGIPVAWLVNLTDDSLRVCSDPAEGAYRTQRRTLRGERIGLPHLHNVSVSVDEILGPVRA